MLEPMQPAMCRTAWFCRSLCKGVRAVGPLQESEGSRVGCTEERAVEFQCKAVRTIAFGACESEHDTAAFWCVRK